MTEIEGIDIVVSIFAVLLLIAFLNMVIQIRFITKKPKKSAYLKSRQQYWNDRMQNERIEHWVKINEQLSEGKLPLDDKLFCDQMGYQRENVLGPPKKPNPSPMPPVEPPRGKRS